ncbi:FUSC family protein [Deefgea tanakiae]|uniref:FUSC family protein n=1 Tax=Deefgea tanakiae TaxID=2865840 RepID=A0ABX8ZA68_9NEIS|nr:FUSC family protein [Deefgea tanakiae]QZA77764.1 FUSC family protein [Deefgea tanakiae]
MQIAPLFSTPWRVLKHPVFLYEHFRAIHALRVALAFLFGGAIDLYFAIPYGTWTLITIVVLMGNGPTQGDISRKSGQRVLGTFYGALAGLLAVVFYLVTPWLGLSWMIFMIALSAYHALGKNSEAAVVAGVTLVIVGGLGESAIEESFWRLGNVLIGAIIAMFFANLFPTRAIDRWRFLLAENLREVALAYRQIGPDSQFDIGLTLERVNSRLQKMRLLIPSATKESGQESLRFDALHRHQRMLYLFLERSSDAASTAPPFADNRRLRSMIFRSLMRSARAARFLRNDLQDGAALINALSAIDEVDFLTQELAQVSAQITDELHLLMPDIVRTQHPLSQLKPAALRYLKR